MAHALSSDIRMNILKLLHQKKMNINEIAEELNLPVSTIASNVRVLEGAGIIYTEILRASRGTMKVCSIVFEDIHMDLKVKTQEGEQKNVYQIEMPIGHYFDCDVSPTCGLISKNGISDQLDEPSVFFHPDRVNAQLLWFRKGHVSYRFPLMLPSNATLQSIEFSLEVCSETTRYNNNWPSDISVWVNEREISTWTCPGDFGDRRGILNPVWYPSEATQYGLLKTWKMDLNGSYLDGVKVSGISLADIFENSQDYITFKVGVKSTAANVGGINIFGKELGDYAQDIMMRVIYLQN